MSEKELYPPSAEVARIAERGVTVIEEYLYSNRRKAAIEYLSGLLDGIAQRAKDEKSV